MSYEVPFQLGQIVKIHEKQLGKIHEIQICEDSDIKGDLIWTFIVYLPNGNVLQNVSSFAIDVVSDKELKQYQNAITKYTELSFRFKEIQTAIQIKLKEIQELGQDREEIEQKMKGLGEIK